MTTTSSVIEQADQSLIGNYARLPVVFERGEGSWLIDADGERYLDLLSGIAVCSTGHCHPDIVAAVQEQAAKLIHVSNLFYTEPMVELAEQLASSSLGGKVFFCNSGAEANEAAIKLARKAKPRGEIVVLTKAFHGRTYGALSATPQESKQAPFEPLVPGFVSVPRDSVESLTTAVSDKTAAVMIEPLQGESGVLPVSDEMLLAARDACDRYGALLIFDEIQTGLGRTGSLFAYEQTPVVPDLLTVAKALGSGLPIGALITNPDSADVLAPGDHGTTFGGGPLVAAAALATLKILADPELHAAVREHGAELAAAVSELPGVTEVRQKGLMLGFEISGDALAAVRYGLEQENVVINATGPNSPAASSPGDHQR